MTNRIPVGATIARAWRFVVRDFINILGVSAPAILLSWVPSILMYVPGAPSPEATMGGDPARIAHLLPFLLLLYPAIFLLLSMQLLGIAHLASGAKKSARWLYISLAWPVWRLLGSILLLLVAIFLIAAVAVFGFGALAVLVKLALGGNPAGWVSALGSAIIVVGSIVAWCAVVYTTVRLMFLLIPVIAAGEPGFAMVRGWTLGAGNFWRMFALLVTVWLPLILAEGVLLISIFRGAPFPPPHASPEQTAAFQAVMNAHIQQLFSGAVAYWYVTLPVFTAVMVLFYGFAVATQIFAYETVRGSTPVPGDALP